MNEQLVNETFENYLKNNEISCASLIVRRDGEIVFKNKWGFADKDACVPVEYDTVYRLMSMTKCLTAVAVMICVERGLIGLDKPLSDYIPEFAGMPVCDEPKYAYDEDRLKLIPLYMLTFNMQKVKRRPASREITIRDLLSHTSGLQQGIAGFIGMLREKPLYDTLRDYVLHYTSYVLDFDPGTCTSYSPFAGFDVLGYVVSLVSGKSLEDFMRDEIFTPLKMNDTTFFPDEELEKRLCKIYKRKRGQLVDVTGTKADVCGSLKQKTLKYEQGSGGLFSTLEDYDRFGMMLFNGGELDGVRILSPETVRLMHTEAPAAHLEPDPGCVWGLGMKIRQDQEKGGYPATVGTYGWSGAYGTHFFISPADGIETVFMMNRSDIGGAQSPIISKVEELVFGVWGKK